MSKSEYNKKIREYVALMDEIKKVQTQSKRTGNNESAYVLMLDSQRNELHNELKAIAPEIGKSEADVNIDILSKRKNLRDYNLPELSIIQMESLDEFGGRVAFFEDDQSGSQRLGEYMESPTDGTVFIPFGEIESWHLFQEKGFFQRKPETLEERRRAQEFAFDAHEIARYAEIELPETFHQGIKMHGVIIDKNKYDEAISILARNREKYSPSQHFFDQEALGEDIKTIIREDIAEIINQANKYEEARKKRELPRLLDQYENNSIYKDEHVKELLSNLVAEKRTELEKEQANEDAERHMREGMGRRR